MDQELIVKALKKACGNKSFKFQVIIQNDKLYIYANHRANYQPNYELLQDNVAMAIASLALDSLDSVWLYCRPLGIIEPNWQALVELPNQINQDNEDTLGIAEDLESDIDFAPFKEFIPENSTGDNLTKDKIIENNYLEKLGDNELNLPDFDDFLDEDSTGDTGLLQETGLIHGTPLKEEEINFQTFSTSAIEAEAIASENADGNNNSLNDNSFAEYCFVTNKKLLTSDIISPGKEIIRLVKFFHHLSENNQHKLLPILEGYFLQAETPNLEKMAIAIHKWFKQIGELNFDDHHLFAIWLSRYCFAPDTTLEEFKTIAVQDAAAETTKKAKIHSTEYSFTPANFPSDSAQNESLDELNEPKFQLPPIIKKLIFPSVWVLVTVILLVLGIMTNNSNTVIASEKIPSLCSNTIGDPNYCRLAVNLVGDKTISQSPKSLFPLTEVTETVATYGCERYANLKARISSNIAPEQTPVISSHGEKIFPHIYAITAKQKNAESLRNTHVGCVYTTGQGQRSPELLGADIIPENWPTENYQKQAGLNDNLTFGIFTQPINLGLYTIFAAWGIAIASWSNLGIKIHRPQTIYFLAVILGIVQVVVSSISFLGIVGAVALPIVVIIAASYFIKDFQLNWNRGYPLIAMFMMIAIQFLFYGLCLGLINGFV